MPKVLGEAGVSLSPMYDVEGSSVGVEDLLAKDVNLVHEMGSTIFSERLNSDILLFDTGAIAQSTAFNVGTVDPIPDSPGRIINVQCFALNASETTSVVFQLSDPSPVPREIPFWMWHSTPDIETQLRWRNEGAAVGTAISLRSLAPNTLPVLLTRTNIGKVMPEIFMRGLTSAFGAGTGRVFGLLTFSRANAQLPTPGAPSSHGLPVPSW